MTSIKILVVDDEPDLEQLIKQKFRRKIREREYDFVFATSGIDALAKLDQHPDTDIVLSDINMPEMDGLALLVRLGELNPIVKAIIVSAYGDMDNIRSAMNRGAFDFVTKPVNFDDLELTISKTIKHVGQLKETLKSVRENSILKMYVDSNVLNFMTRAEFANSIMASESIEATVMFVDICSFTAISEKQPAGEVVKLLNKYFDVIVPEIMEQSGYVDKFIGDAVMAIFKGEHHTDRAVEAAVAVRDKINTLSAYSADGLSFSPKVSIGLNVGGMVSGNIGSETLKRLDYTVIGDVVNTAQRYQSAAAAGQIVVGENIYALVKESFRCEKIGEVKLKNKEHASLIYEVVA
jgi:adenylate cyclase